MPAFPVIEFDLKSVTPYSASNFFESEPADRESMADFDKRCWREKAHVNRNGHVIIPGNQFRASVMAASGRLSLQIKGKGKTTCRKYIEAGLIVEGDIDLGITREELESEVTWCNADGKPGSGTRVKRTFPLIREWSGSLRMTVLDNIVTTEILQEHVEYAGRVVGIGRWRPEKRGMYGRYLVTDMKIVS